MNLKDFDNAVKNVSLYTKLLDKIISNYNDIIILGNGGSNSIASHIAQDYTKVLGKNAITFSDPSRLTCYANDYGFENANKMFLQEFCKNDTLVILISSSGESKNMTLCADFCIKQNIDFIVLTGFEEDNYLNKLESPLLNFHVPYGDYGIVEITHLLLLHSIL